MARFSKNLVKAFVKENNLKKMDDVLSALKELFAETLQSMLEAELNTELGYEKHDVKRKTSSNSRNRKSKKQLRTNTVKSKSLCLITVTASSSLSS